jgi:ATP-dependent Clp protease ATP-binding subunit ClpX
MSGYFTEEQILQLKANRERFIKESQARKELEVAEAYMREEKLKAESKPSIHSYLGYHPSALVRELDKTVLHQDAAKKELALTLSHSALRHSSKFIYKNDIKIDKKTLLLTGDTGVGKTLLVKTACELLNLPLLIVDCSATTGEGWHGKGMHEHLNKFSQLIKEMADEKETSYAAMVASSVVYLDEFDKLSLNLSSDHNKDSAYTKQFNLLKLLEGCKLESIDTTDMTFILSGSFHEFAAEKEKHKSIGFSALMDEKISEMDRAQFFKEAGIISELAGRITTVVNLVNLTVEDYVKILSHGKNSLIAQYKALFELYDKELNIKAEDLLAIAEKAAKLKIGARGLNTVFVEFFSEKLYNIDEPAEAEPEVKLLNRSI